jgi:enoyl-CoA hydratase/carnithine racemase
MTDKIKTHRDGASLAITIDRADKANAISKAMVLKLKAIFLSCANDEELRVVTLTGAGKRTFCGGADLSQLTEMTGNPEEAVWEEIADALSQVPALTIAKINGACIGGGLSLALGCDIRVAVSDAVFGYPALRNGIFPSTQDCLRLRELIGPGRMSSILMGASRISAKQAAEWGLVEHVVDRNGLEPTVSTLSEAALSAPRHNLTTMKNLTRGRRN